MGGHGGLNILPQKSWNVYGQRNRQKVAEDEAAEREKQAKDRGQQTKGDRVARVNFLRKQAPAEESHSIDEHVALEQEHHINFWAQQESASRNPEAEAEKAAQLRKRGDPKTQTSDARFDERFAVLHGQTGPAPWYASHKTSMYSEDPSGVDHSRSTELVSVRSVLQKSRNTQSSQSQVLRTRRRGEPQSGLPMPQQASSEANLSGTASARNLQHQHHNASPQHASERISGKCYREKKHKKQKKRGRERRRSRSRSRSPEPSAGRSSKSKPHQSKRHRHRSPSATRSSSSSGDGGARGLVAAGGAHAANGFEALRRERLERERAEAQRSRQLMRDHFGRN